MEKKSLIHANAKRMRKEMTKEEKHLWHDFLKKLPIQVYRQKVLGEYIVDFYIASAKIVIELDGIQHQFDSIFFYDKKRTLYLEKYGIKVLRYSNELINNNFKEVCIDVLNHVGLSFDDLK